MTWGALLLVVALAPGARPQVSGELSPSRRQGALETGRVSRAVLDALDRGERRRVIIVFAEPAALDLSRGLHRFGPEVDMAGRITPRGLRVLLDDPVVPHIDFDEGGRGHLLEALPLTNTDDVGGAGCCPGGGSSQSGDGAAADDHGHGTNVTGIVTSDGGLAPLGAAPDAAIVAIKVLDSNNSFCCSSDVIAGLDWILANRPDVDLVDMSLGTSATYSGDCDGATATTMLYADAVDTLRGNGVLSVVSSLNGG